MHLYVHIPFCRRICPYCGFYKHTPGDLANRAFVEAVLKEADSRTGELDASIRTIYFGGGTPSLLSPALLERLCQGLAERFDFSGVLEWTIEANPETFGEAKAAGMRELGIDRVSLGIQSFDPEILQTLGRDHSPEEAGQAYDALRAAGFDNVSIDLMFSIPGQSLQSWQCDLDTAASLDPDHISAYNLTYEEDTEFLERHEAGQLDTDENRDADFFHQAIDFLESKGFEHYEISNYAKPGRESLHNRAYWEGANYLGLGPGAVSTIDGKRWKTLPDTAAYVRALTEGADVRTEREILTSAQLQMERLALLLRTREGAPIGLVPEPNPVESLIEQGLICLSGDRLILTRKGKALADPVAAALV